LQVARILVDHPRILVTDEATANLDYATEREVKEALSRLSYRPTMLVTAHRYTMAQNADHVVISGSRRRMVCQAGGAGWSGVHATSFTASDYLLLHSSRTARRSTA
jgi:ABC-type transport system involved in cytochrome bd biosynthesis fused ATPase/permease subunit